MNWDLLVSAGSVAQTNSAQSLVKVNVLGRETKFLPVLQIANSFKKSYTPIREGEQVLVFINRYVIRGLFNTHCKEPKGANEHTDIVEYADGTRIEYNAQTKVLKTKCVGKVIHEAPDIELIGNIKLMGDVAHQGTFNNTDGINTDGSISDKKGDLTSHPHPNAAPRE